MNIILITKIAKIRQTIYSENTCEQIEYGIRLTVSTKNNYILI